MSSLLKPTLIEWVSSLRNFKTVIKTFTSTPGLLILRGFGNMELKQMTVQGEMMYPTVTLTEPYPRRINYF